MRESAIKTLPPLKQLEKRLASLTLNLKDSQIKDLTPLAGLASLESAELWLPPELVSNCAQLKMRTPKKTGRLQDVIRCSYLRIRRHRHPGHYFLERVLSALSQANYVFLLGLMRGVLSSVGFPAAFCWVSRFLAGECGDFAPVDREVGYLAAPNWSLAYAVFFPASLYLMTKSLQGIADALDSLHVRRMVRNVDMQVVQESVLTESWMRGTSTRSRLLVIFAATIPTIYSIGEWLPFNLLRLVHSPFAPKTEHSDFDWGLAGIMHAPCQPEWSPIHRLINAGFDLLAFSTEGLLIGHLLLRFSCCFWIWTASCLGAGVWFALTATRTACPRHPTCVLSVRRTSAGMFCFSSLIYDLTTNAGVFSYLPVRSRRHWCAETSVHLSYSLLRTP